MLDNMQNKANIFSLGLRQSTFNLLYRGFIYIALILFQAPLLAHELPDLGNPSSAALTPLQEMELGSTVMQELKGASMISQDAIFNEFLQTMGYRLVATQGQSQPKYVFFGVKDKSINAFALPGGFVGINTGLFLATESESELAGVMAHEVAHVQQRHIARIYEHMGRLRLSTIAGMIAGLLISTQNAQAGQGAIAATLAGSQQSVINYTRDHEKEADFVGIQTMMKAGYDPHGMPSFFQRMYQDTRYYGNHIPEYLMTHPLTESRIVAAQSRAASFPYKQIPDSSQYHLVHERMKAQSFSSPVEASHYFEKVLAKGTYRSREGSMYGYALSLIESGKFEQASSILNELLVKSPNQPLYHLAYAELDWHNGNQNAALDRLSQAIKNHPQNYPLTLSYATTLLKSGQGSAAIPILKKQASLKPNHPECWHLLSAAYALSKQDVKAHLAEAQYLKLQGDLQGAITQLRLANKYNSLTHEERVQIQGQLREYKKIKK